MLGFTGYILISNSVSNQVGLRFWACVWDMEKSVYDTFKSEKNLIQFINVDLIVNFRGMRVFFFEELRIYALGRNMTTMARE